MSRAGARRGLPYLTGFRRLASLIYILQHMVAGVVGLSGELMNFADLRSRVARRPARRRGRAQLRRLIAARATTAPRDAEVDAP